MCKLWKFLPEKKCYSYWALHFAISSEVWLGLLAYVICTNREANSEQLYITFFISSNELPCRCVLNRLQTVPVPPELDKFDVLSVPSAIKLLWGLWGLARTRVKYPVTIPSKPVRGLCSSYHYDQVESSMTALPDPELYIIVNGKPTKSKVVWRS